MNRFALGATITVALIVALLVLVQRDGDPRITSPGPTGSPSAPITPGTPTPGADPVIAAAGDIACDRGSGSYRGGTGTAISCRQRYTSDLLLAGGYTAVLTLGDLAYPDGRLQDFETAYEESWGRVKDKTYPVPGNHDYHTKGAAGYYGYFGERAGDPRKGYYSFDIGAWHIVALNSICSGVAGGCGPSSAQAQWLRADLAAHPATCTLAYWHHSRFSSGAQHGNNDDYDAFWRALYDAGADVVLTGHDHTYERFAPQSPTAKAEPDRGIRAFVVGTGGRSHYGFGRPEPNSEVRNGDTFGVLELTLHPESYEWRFVPEAGKTFTDTGSSDCH